MNVTDALMIAVGFDTTALAKGAKDVDSALTQTERNAGRTAKAIEKAAKDAERAAEKALKDQERAADKAARQQAKASKDAAAAAAKDAKDAAAAHDKQAESIGNVTRKLVGLYALFTGGRGIAEFAGFITSADAALGRFAVSLGVVPQSVSALGMAIERNGGSAAAAATAYQTLGDAIAGIKLGQGSGILQALGQLSGLSGVAIDITASRDKQLEQIGHALNAGGKRDANLASLLGRQIVGQGFTEWAIPRTQEQQAADLAESRKNTPTEESLAQSKELIRQFTAAKQASEDLGRQIFVALAPAINEVLSGIKTWIEENKEWLASSITPQVKAFAEYLKTVNWKRIAEDIKVIVGDANAVAQAFGGWTTVIDSLFALWIGGKFIAAMKNLASFMALMRLPIPPWLAAIVGLGAAAKWAYGQHSDRDKENEAEHPGELQGGLGGGDIDQNYGSRFGRWFGGTRLGKWLKPHKTSYSGRENGSDRRGGGHRRGRENTDSNVISSNPELTVEGRAFLDTIASSEAGHTRSGGYDSRYPSKTFDNGYRDHPRIREVIRSGPNAGRTSDAAGRYQFLSSTWDPIARKLHLKDFSPANQDKAAWYLAQQEYSRLTHGGNLQKDLASGDPAKIARAGRLLHGTWTSLPGGIEQGQNQGLMMQRYGRNLSRQRQHQQPSHAPAPEAPKLPAAPKEPSMLNTLWHGIDGAADYSNRLQRMAMASTIHHYHGSIDNSRSASSHIGELHLHTQATDGQAVAADLRRDLERRGLGEQADYGLS